VQITSRQDLERTLAPLHACFEGRESEHNWAAREAAIVKLRGILRAPGAVGKLGEAIGREVKALGEGIVKGVSGADCVLLVGEREESSRGAFICRPRLCAPRWQCTVWRSSASWHSS